MISKDALKAYTEKTTVGMTMANSTPQQEVAREIAVSLGHGSSVQAVLDELRKAKGYMVDAGLPQYAAAYDHAIGFIVAA